MSLPLVSVDRLQPGVFIELDLPWHRHPFLFNRFRIKDEEDIEILRDLGLRSVRFDPRKSEAQPRPRPRPRFPRARKDVEPMAADKRQRIERLRERRERYNRCDKQFRRQVQSAKSMMSDIRARPQQAMKQATLLVSEMADVLSAEGELMVHLMGDQTAHETVYFHSLNVAVLAMMLGERVGLDGDALRVVGLGALFHDVGQQRIPHSVLHKPTPWTRAEREFVQQHPHYGVEIAKKINAFPEAALTIIEQHHELGDGSGYPLQLEAKEISNLTKVVQVANVYDNLCNPHNVRKAKSPHQALSYMLAYQNRQLDPQLIQAFVKSLGVYPPGSVVRLSNDMLGIVISVDQQDLLNPSLLVYDPAVPKSEALVVDLVTEPDVSIVAEVPVGDLTPEVVNYLSPRTRVSYYFDAAQPSKLDRR